MNFVLDAHEARLLGCLIEKERTTPEYYPLTLNAVIAACNQKSNRDPLMHLHEEDVRRAFDKLHLKKLTYLKHTAGGRVPKHAHQLENFYTFSPQETAILCLLLLRGPQTSGELKSRAGRLCSFGSTSEVEATLEELMTREDGPFVARLPRQPGRSACRYTHLLCGEVDIADVPEPIAKEDAETIPPPQDDRMSKLEDEVATLREELDQLKKELGVEPEQQSDPEEPTS